MIDINRRLLLLCILTAAFALSGCGGSKSGSPTLFPVGRTSFDWTDTGRAEKYGPAPGGPRKIVVYLWYPAAPGGKATMGPLLPEGQAAALAPLAGIPKETLLSLPCKSYIDAPLAAGRGSFPVLVMSHGNDTATLLYNSTAEYLAARGYLVVGISHTYNANWTIFKDNRIAVKDDRTDPSLALPALTQTSPFADFDANWANQAAIDADISNDVPFVLDKLAELNAVPGPFQGRLRMDQIGMFGHSFGGSHAFRILQEDSRIKAAGDVDGTLFNLRFADGAPRPFLVLSSERPSAAEKEAAKEALRAAGMTADQVEALVARGESERRAFENSPHALYVQLTKAKHGNFTDIGLLASFGFPQDDISATASPQALLTTSNEYLTAFFDENLRGIYSPLLHRTPTSPDIVLEQRPGKDRP